MTTSKKTWQTPALGETSVREALGPTGATSLSGPTGGMQRGPAGPFGPFGPFKAMQGEGPPVQPSDVRLKEDICPAGRADNGLPLYTFRYRGGEGRYEGVMAQDVLQVRPDAVVTGDDGYLRVDYARLGLTLRRLG
ncbi:MAG: tail fiber domain-containing protein [Reyranellaceae bacterium]